MQIKGGEITSIVENRRHKKTFRTWLKGVDGSGLSGKYKVWLWDLAKINLANPIYEVYTADVWEEK